MESATIAANGFRCVLQASPGVLVVCVSASRTAWSLLMLLCWFLCCPSDNQLCSNHSLVLYLSKVVVCFQCLKMWAWALLLMFVLTETRCIKHQA
jgi:hypothetical protein